MSATTVEVKFDESEIENLEFNLFEAMWKTAQALHTDVVQAETIPRDTGTLSLDNTYVEKYSDGGFNIVSNTSYAKRLYYHPEYKFRKDLNTNAGAYWFEPYISGDKKEFVHDTFIHFAKGG